jgi:hypothetical protein
VERQILSRISWGNLGKIANVGELEIVFEMSFMGSQTNSVVHSPGVATRSPAASAPFAIDTDLFGTTQGSTTVQCGQEFIL